MRDPVMRLRCPNDTDPAREVRHLAFDVRLPVDVSVLASFTHATRRLKCACGAPLVIRTVPDEMKVSNG